MTIMLLLSLTHLVGAQDGATSQLPTGIVNKTPDKPKEEEPKKDPPPPPAEEKKEEKVEEKKEEEHHDEANPEHAAEGGAGGDDKFLKDGKKRIKIDSIHPTHGPTYGDTKVIVRGGPFAQYQQEHPEPKCKFGDAVAGGAYVPCPLKQPKAYEKEGGRAQRTALCI